MSEKGTGSVAPAVHWSRLYEMRHQPLGEHRVRLTSKQLAARLVAARTPILDFGSSRCALQRELELLGYRGIYLSLDVDPEVPATYRSLCEVPRGLGAICALEVIEHLSLDEAVATIPRWCDLLAEGGLLVLSTPDPSHPTWIREDITHRQHYPVRDTAALVRMFGFVDIEVFHILDLANPDRLAGPVGRAKTAVGRLSRTWLTRLTGVNFESRSYLLAATKPMSSC